VRKLQRVKVLFEDDLRAAVASFDKAFGEVEQRVLQVVHNFVESRRKPERPPSPTVGKHIAAVHSQSIPESSTLELDDEDLEEEAVSRPSPIPDASHGARSAWG
jgi:hypothetical protein